MADAIDLVIEPRRRQLGEGMAVARTLPHRTRRAVGPFVFTDRMGPAELAPGTGVDVPPHPHIGLATVTLLFDGALEHRDSLGVTQEIRPGEVNWMTAGRGVAHSERTPAALRATGSRIDGLQTWVALPRAAERGEPGFEHRGVDELPLAVDGPVALRVLVGSHHGMVSPVAVASPLVEATLDLGAGAEHRLVADHEELAVQLVSGVVEVDGRRFAGGELVVLRPGATPVLAAPDGPASVVLLGGDRLDGPRHIRWNFVASDPAWIDAAEADWDAGRWPAVPGDPERVARPGAVGGAV